MAPTYEPGIRLRSAGPEDAGTLHEMIMSMARETGAADDVSSCVDDFLRYGFSDPPAFHALIAERDGKGIGMCLFFFSFSTWRGTRGVYVQDIYVAKGERGGIVASMLIAETARLAGQQGAKYMRLSVNRENLRARKFYEKLGLSCAEHECIYMAKGDAFEALKAPGGRE